MDDEPSLDLLLTVRQVARSLGICARGVWRLVAQCKFPKPVYVGRCARWPQSEVTAYIERLKEARRS